MSKNENSCENGKVISDRVINIKILKILEVVLESNTDENDSDDQDYFPGTVSDDTNPEIDFFKFFYKKLINIYVLL